MISAVILTKNEEKNLRECLHLLEWCGEIIVLDDESTDETTKIAQEMGAKIFSRKLGSDFSEQRNFGLSKAKGEWIFFVDADERVNNELKEEIIKSINNNPEVNGYFLKRKDFFINRFLNHGETGSLKLLRLGRKDSGVWQREVDETWKLEGKTKILNVPLLHYSHLCLSDFLTSINQRSTLNAGIFYKEGKKLTFIEWLKPCLKFLQNFFFRFGFLDGTAGFIFAVLMSCHSYLVRGKLYLLWKKNEKQGN